MRVCSWSWCSPARANPLREAARACADARRSRRAGDRKERKKEKRHRFPRRTTTKAREFLAKAARGAPNRVPVAVDHGALLETLSRASDARRYAAPLLHFLVTECDAFASRALAAGVRRRGGEAGRHHARARAHLGARRFRRGAELRDSRRLFRDDGAESRRRRVPVRVHVRTGDRRRRVRRRARVRRASPGSRPDLRRGLRRGGAAARLRIGGTRTHENALATPSPAQSRTVLTALFGALARLARRGGSAR